MIISILLLLIRPHLIVVVVAVKGEDRRSSEEI